MSQPRDPRSHGAAWRPGDAPYTRRRPAAPPPSADLRLLLRLTVASFTVSVLGSAVGFVTMPEQGATGAGAMGTAFTVAMFLVGVVVSAGLYAVVYFPLRERRQWAWIVGIVLASMAILFTLLNLVLFFAVPVGSTLSLVPALLKVAVDAAWLVVAVRPGVRAVLR
ncbi:hypothetical protein ACH9EU_00230 [Kocuria sp. M1R5S2]|uniref:hypothetical protein n=1 Tax=Kocuria rhizosphaerae TaxID=3376285 RepID=UPI0037A6CA77